uniref:C2 domain-containing protein n=1 Tax=Globisporangium ultimum (strain ATCC 200006 / CBS 805.95 / DAOM BR144) TaxID=431595 RepID=K3X617_GLOUD
MLKKMKPEAAAGKRFLRVQAEGAQGIHASDSKFSRDAKPDPYVVFVLGNVAHKCENVNDVEPLKYFAWPNAVKDFEIMQEKTLTESSLVIHVKDSDTIKDRYIGGASIPLGPLRGKIQAK